MRKIVLSVIASIVVSNLIIAQEVLTDLYTNPVLTSFVPNVRLKMVSSTDILSLPFWDDFSNNDVYPDENLWTNNSVFINNTYAKGPTTIGVATFDAVDANGFHYSHASSVPFEADKLISQKIDLENADQNTTWLSFYYQPQGNGNAPELNDSLILYFQDDESQWNKVWYSTGMEFKYFRDSVLLIDPDRTRDTNEFKLVMVQVDSAKYFTDAFKFQFKNYASLAGDYNPSAAVNCDHWNIDYVFLDQARDENDTVFKDIAFVQPPNSFLRTYESVPWSHYDEVQKANLSKEYFYIRNNFNEEFHIEATEFLMKDIEANHMIDSFNVSAIDINPFYNLTSLDWQFSKDPFYQLEQDELHVEYELRLTTNDDYPQNNSVFKDFHFSNYYAYDDGTAENAYGIEANGAKLAYRFTSHIADSLKGVDMYFLRVDPEDEAVDAFSLCVWADNNGVPGELLIEDGKVPEFSNETNEFATYEFSRAIAVDGTFYIGWIQKSAERINVGFDVNKKSQDNIFYDIYGTWENSSVSGSLMMRPLLGYVNTTSIKSEASKATELKIYPNPANNHLYFSDLDYNENHTITIYNSMGTLLYQGEAEAQGIDVSQLTNGLYIVSLTSNNNKPKVARLIISR